MSLLANNTNLETMLASPAGSRLPPNIHEAEIQLQSHVLRILSSGNNEIVMKLIDKISPELRTIITDFEKQDGRLPTADEIIWIIGEHHKVDPRYIDRLLEDRTDTPSAQTIKQAIQDHTASIGRD